ncbi:amidohydrolase family protein [Luteimonas sp. WGS1318]|uniref:amidohydrolase family protein n=1 Tax=Luteimonas sp. WGS1318 TaxID=3366815 RepID=UPI00372D23DA
MHPLIPWSVAGLLTCLPPVSAQAAPKALALDGVRIVDVDDGRSGTPRCVRIEDGRIAGITRPGSRACRRDAEVVTLTDRYLMPGLIDMHAHLSLGPLDVRRDGDAIVMEALPDDAIAEHNATRLVGFGVTTIRNPAGDLAAAARYEARRADGTLTGPESFDAGPVLNDAGVSGLATAVSTTDDVRRVVAEQVDAGADWIKLYTGLSPTLLQAGIEAAHAHGRPAVGHLEDVAWTDALSMGLDGLVHLMPVSPDLLAPADAEAYRASRRPGAFAFFEWWEHFDPDGPQADRLVAAFDRHRPVFDATLVAFQAAFVQDRDDSPYRRDAGRYAHPRLLANWTDVFTFAIGWEPADFERARAVWPKVQRMAARLYAGDARMTLGTDMSNPWIAPGISLHREMALLAEAGVPNARILRAGTANAADALGAGQRLGRVAVGYEADLLLLDGDPLVDLAHARDAHAVVLDGRYLDRAALAALRGDE